MCLVSQNKNNGNEASLMRGECMNDLERKSGVATHRDMRLMYALGTPTCPSQRVCTSSLGRVNG